MKNYLFAILVIIIFSISGCNQINSTNSALKHNEEIIIQDAQEETFAYLSTLDEKTFLCRSSLISVYDNISINPFENNRYYHVEGCEGIKVKLIQMATLIKAKSNDTFFKIQFQDNSTGWVHFPDIQSNPICKFNIDCSDKIKVEKGCSDLSDRNCYEKDLLGHTFYYKTVNVGGFCNNGVCGIRCYSNNDCQDGVCSLKENKCVGCLSDNNCKSGYCLKNRDKQMFNSTNYEISGRCVECIEESDCSMGKTCFNNKCEY